MPVPGGAFDERIDRFRRAHRTPVAQFHRQIDQSDFVGQVVERIARIRANPANDRPQRHRCPDSCFDPLLCPGNCRTVGDQHIHGVTAGCKCEGDDCAAGRGAGNSGAAVQPTTPAIRDTAANTRISTPHSKGQ